MRPAVSVALCTHNGSSFIAEQLLTIVSQSVSPSEIVVSDDASSDTTLEIVHAFARTLGSSIRLIVIENPEPLGVVQNFEQAMRATSGDFIALSDQDDVWHRGRLEASLDRFAASPELLLVCGNARLVDAQGNPLGSSLFDALEIRDDDIDSINAGCGLGELLRRNLVTGATTMVRRRLLELAAPFPKPWVHDEWLAMIAAAAGEIGVSAEQLTDYRQHGGNQIGASKLSLRAKFGRLREPRNGRNDYLLERAVVLRDRLDEMGADVHPGALARVSEKVIHQRARAAIPASHLRRVIPVAREAATGRYAHYSRGWLDILRDLVQPA